MRHALGLFGVDVVKIRLCHCLGAATAVISLVQLRAVELWLMQTPVNLVVDIAKPDLGIVARCRLRWPFFEELLKVCGTITARV